MTRTEHIKNEAGKERSNEEREAFIRGALFADSLSQRMLTSKDEVLDNVARAGISLGLLQSTSRLQPLCWARVAVAWKLRDLGMSSTAIGRLINRHHSSVLAMWQQAESWFENAKAHAFELAFVSDVLAGEKVDIPKPKTIQRYAPNVPREALCVECASYPCFRGLENMASNLAETCKSFQRK